MAFKVSILQDVRDYVVITVGLLIARECGPIAESTYRAAVTLELLHTASLVHDDVVDESDERRGQASANSVYGNQIAVLVGDYILSLSLQQAARTGSLPCVEIIATLGATLSEGEVFQLANVRNEQANEDDYFHVIDRKTAALFAACGELAALTAGADASFVENARRFGAYIGICFQIRDDIFDYFSDSAIGKPTANDMAEGKLTLPALYALRQTPASSPIRPCRTPPMNARTEIDTITTSNIPFKIRHSPQKMQNRTLLGLQNKATRDI